MTSSLPSCSGLSHTKNVVECVSLSTTMRFPSASGLESKYTQVSTAEKSQFRTVGSWSQVELPVTFGLGTGTSVEAIRVIWPDGYVQAVDVDVEFLAGNQ